MTNKNKDSQVIVTETSPGVIDIKCSCGKPIVKSTESGMYCEDSCNLKENEEAMKLGMKMIDNFTKMFNLK
jgi:hypothetical protein